jgi:hypothetical protein
MYERVLTMILFSEESLNELTPAFEAIGVQAETELTPEQADKLSLELLNLALYVRLLGRLETAQLAERTHEVATLRGAIELQFSALANEFKWNRV